MPIKNIIFDIDGTLYPIEVFNRNQTRLFFRHPVLSLQYAHARHAVRHRRDSWPPFTGCKTVKEKEDAVFSSPGKFARYYWLMENRDVKLPPFEGLKDSLTALKKNGIKIFALSDFPVENKLKELGVSELFSGSFSTCDMPYTKPHIYPYQMIVKTQGIIPEETAFVGDRPEIDALGAAKAGMVPIVIDPKAKYNISSVQKLSQSEKTLIVRNYQELIKLILERS